MMNQNLVKDSVKALKPYIPGKPIEEVKREYGIQDVIKMASNENPLGPSPVAVEAMRKELEHVNLYPDGACFSLKTEMAKFLNVKESELFFGNGSDELIHYIGLTFMQPGEEILQADITFSQYEAAALYNECKVIRVPLKDLTYDLDGTLAAITPKTRLIFITNPNNPTGTFVNNAEVDRFMEKLPDNVITVFDEAYIEYVDRDDCPDTIKYVREGRNVIVLRTFSKIYGLAGLRIGYGIAPENLANYINQVRAPFNVNVVAQVGAIASLKDKTQIERSLKMNAEGKRYFYEQFDRLGLKYQPSVTNFVFLDLGVDSVTAFTKLLKRGVIVRTGDIFGLPTWIRVTIGTPEENHRFIGELENVLAEMR